jgi:RHS repeat-associated protein
VVAYGYDAASRVTSIAYTQGMTRIGILTYTYDANGRRTGMGGSWAKVNLPAAITSATYNANNQLINWNGTTLSYDLNGNMTYDGATTYTWDARNRLGAFGSTTFTYDSFGRRTQNATGISFLYDGANAVQELSGSTVSANLLTGGVDEIFTRTDSAGTRNFLGDALGSTLALTDSTGTVQTQYSYEPFGKTTATGSASSSTFQYTGRENDGTGMYYYRARYYNPTLGRFISEDPAGLGGGDANFYVYAGNGPADYIDPSGETRKDPTCGPGSYCDPFGPFSGMGGGGGGASGGGSGAGGAGTGGLGQCMLANRDGFSLLDLAQQLGLPIPQNGWTDFFLGNDVMAFVAMIANYGDDPLGTAASGSLELGIPGGYGTSGTIGGGSGLQTLFPRRGRPAQVLLRSKLAGILGVAVDVIEFKAPLDVAFVAGLIEACRR